MPISVDNDVVNVFDENTLQSLGQKYGATVPHLRDSLKVACIEVVCKLASHADTIDGAEQIYRQVSEFNGSVISAVENGLNDGEADPIVLFGTGCLHKLLGTQMDEITESTKHKQELSQVAASNIVGLTSAITLDTLGTYREKFGLKRDNLTEILRSQAELNATPVDETHGTNSMMQSLGLAPSQIQVQDEGAYPQTPIEPPVPPTPLSSSPTAARTTAPPRPEEIGPEKNVSLEDMFTATQTKENVPTNKTKATTRVQNANNESTKANPDDIDTLPSQLAKPRPKPKSKWEAKKKRNSKKLLYLGVPLLLLSAVGILGWQLFGRSSGNVAQSTAAPDQAVASTAGRSDASGNEADTAVATGTTADQAPPGDANSPATGFSIETKPIASIRIPEDPPRVPLLARFEQEDGEEFDRQLPNFASEFGQLSEEAPNETFWWDQRATPTAREGYVQASKWLVRETPRNNNTKSYFSYD